jgi:hypothetical protein
VAGLIGRRKSVEVLEAMAAAASKGRGGLAIVRGAAGIGKTRLVEELAQRATPWGLDVAWSTCWQGDGAPAFWPWIQTLRDLGLDDAADRLDESSITPAGPESSSTRFALFDSIARDLVTAARSRSALLVIEDLHWAGVGTLLLLRVVADKLASSAPLLVVVTYREEEQPTDPSFAERIGALLSRATLIDLQPLTVHDVAELAESVATTADPVELHRRSGGNPLFVHELVRLYESDGSLAGMPPVIGAVIEQRLKRLAGSTRSLLELAAVAATIGPRGTVGFLVDASGHEPSDVLAGLREAARHGLVRIDAGTWEFTHPLIRDAVEAGIAERHGSELYVRVAETIDGLGLASAHATAVAHLYSAAARFDDDVRDRAAVWSQRAGDHAASVLAFETAARHYGRAVALVPEADIATRIALQLALGGALFAGGDEPAASAAFNLAADDARHHHRVEDLARAALAPGAFEVRMFDRRQVDLLHEALRGIGAQDSLLRTQLLARLAVAETFLAEPGQRRDRSEEAVTIARRLDEPAALAAALAAHLDSIAGPAYTGERLATARELVDLAGSIGDRQLEALGLRFRVVGQLEQGDLPGARSAIGAYAAIAEELASPLYQWYVPLWRAALAIAEGDDRKVDLHQAHAEDLGQRAGSLNAMLLVDSQRWERAVASNSLEQLDALASKFQNSGFTDMLESPTVQSMFGCYHALRGESGAAARILAQLARNRYIAVSDDSEWLMDMVTLGDVSIALGDAEQAATILDLITPHADLWAIAGIGAYVGGSVHAPVGRLAAMLGRRSQAVEHFASAYSAHLESGASALAEQPELRGSCRDYAGPAFTLGFPVRAASACESQPIGAHWCCLGDSVRWSRSSGTRRKRHP